MATVARRLASLGSFFAFAVDDGQLATSPVARTQRPVAEPSGTVPLTEAQTVALLAAGRRLGAKTAVLVDLLLVDGLKLGEVLAANSEDLTEDDATLTVNRRRGPVELDLQDGTALAVAAYLDGRRTGPLLLGDSPTRQPAPADPLRRRLPAQAGGGGGRHRAAGVGQRAPPQLRGQRTPQRRQRRGDPQPPRSPGQPHHPAASGPRARCVTAA
ncbi:MAG: hypothetical protein IT196_03290 [Acidimicrobiales bacterium]|nr:hypothetical protein [Acidimicrobiales bacterium]